VIEKLDRLARDVLHQENCMRDFINNGLNIVSTMEPDMCSTDPTRKLIRQILGSFAEYEREMITLKLAGARKRLADRGQLLMGMAPYGYRKVRQDRRVVLERDPREYPALDSILKLRQELSPCSWAKLAGEINKNAIPTRDNKQWFPATLRRVVIYEEKQRAKNRAG
jgi:DNA invertase Pin-like site-specific DNA recombinase